MPLLCISVLALLLLPPSLTCNTTSPAKEIRDTYKVIVQVDLDHTRTNITTDLQNEPCLGRNEKLPNCTSENVTLVSTLHKLTCRMKKLGLHNTERLTRNVLNSINCPCPGKPTKKPNGQRKIQQRRIKKLCRAKEMLSNMTECYQILSDLLADS